MKENTSPAVVTSEFDTDSPETKDKAEELLAQYYKEHRSDKNFPRRSALLSWKLNEDGTMVIIDGASGRKLTFETDPRRPETFRYIEDAVDAEMKAEDADAEAHQAEADAKHKRVLAEQLKNNAEMKAKAAKKAKLPEPKESK
jgi:hypothetical protein